MTALPWGAGTIWWSSVCFDSARNTAGGASVAKAVVALAYQNVPLVYTAGHRPSRWKTGGILISPRLVAKIESEEPTLRLAVLIDADNAQAAVIEGLLAEIARFGEATVRRIYGDFTAPTVQVRLPNPLHHRKKP